MKNIALALALTAIVAAPAFAEESVKAYEAGTPAKAEVSATVATTSATEVKTEVSATAPEAKTETKTETKVEKKEGMHKKTK